MTIPARPAVQQRWACRGDDLSPTPSVIYQPDVVLIGGKLERIRFDTLRYDGHGMWTCVLEARGGADEHSVPGRVGGPRPRSSHLAALSRAFGDDGRGWP